VREDSSLVQLRSSLADSTGKVQDDITLEDEDEIRLFSRTTFRPAARDRDRRRGAPPGRVPYREGMTIRDAILLADGSPRTPSSTWRSPASVRAAHGALAQTMKVAARLTYLFARRAGEVSPLRPMEPAPRPPAHRIRRSSPTNNVLVLRQRGGIFSAPSWSRAR